MKFVACYRPQESLPNRFSVARITSNGGKTTHQLDDGIIAEHTCRVVQSARFELNKCVAFGDFMSDYLLFKELEHTVSINGDSTLRDLARYHYEGSDLQDVFLTICDALMKSQALRNSLAG